MKEGGAHDRDEIDSGVTAGGVAGKTLAKLGLESLSASRLASRELLQGENDVSVLGQPREIIADTRQGVGKHEDEAMNEIAPTDSGIENGEQSTTDPEVSRSMSKSRGRRKHRKGTGDGDLRGRTGRYDLVKARENSEGSGGESDGVSVELEEGDSNFNSNDECSSISVSDSDDASDSQHSGGDHHPPPPNDDQDHPPRHRDPQPPDLGDAPVSSRQPHLALTQEDGGVHLKSYKVLRPPELHALVGDASPAPPQLTSRCDSNLDRETNRGPAPEVNSYSYHSRTQLSNSLGSLHEGSTQTTSDLQTRDVTSGVSSRAPSSRFVGGGSLNRGWVARINQSLSDQTKPTQIYLDPWKQERSGQTTARPMKHFGKSFNKFVQAKLTKTFSDNRHNRHPPDDVIRNPPPGAETQFSRNESYNRACSSIEPFTPVAEEAEVEVGSPADPPVLIPEPHLAVTPAQPPAFLAGHVVYTDRTREPVHQTVSKDLDLHHIETGKEKLAPSDVGKNETHSEISLTLEATEKGSISEEHENPESACEPSQRKVQFSFPDQLSPHPAETREPLSASMEASAGVVFVSDSPDVKKGKFLDDRRKSLPNFQEDDDDGDFAEDDKDYIPTSHLSRKPAVRRKGYTFVSKSLPRYSRSKSHDPGSSLDLAPSLLNIYDNINAAVNNRHGGHHGHPEGHDSNNPRALTKVTKAQSLPLRSQALPRSTQVPQQPDPLASMMESDDGGAAQPETKKRPLSNGSMSSASNSSLQRLRKKRAHHEADDGCEVQDHVSGTNGESVTAEDQGQKSSDDLGDEVDSRTNTAEQTGSPTPSDGARTPSLAETPPKLSSTPLSSRLHFSSTPNSASSQKQNDSSRSWIPRSKKPNSILNGTVSTSASDLGDSKSSRGQYPRSPPEVDSSNVGVSGTFQTSQTASENRRSTSASSRHEARKRFFSNYEDAFGVSAAVTQTPEKSPPPSAPSLPTAPSVNTPATVVTDSRLVENGRKQTSGDGNRGNSSELTSALEVSESLVKPNNSRLEGSSRVDRKGGSQAHNEKSHRRTERRAAFRSENGQGGANAAPHKSAFTKSTKRKDAGPGAETGSKTGPVYVSYVQRVVTEIIDSERIYIGSLEDIINGYLSPLEHLLTSADAKKDVECLFGNIRQIYQFGCVFLTDLESTGADPVKVAECFVKHNKGFVIYADYCTNYPRAVQVLTKFMQHPELSEFCKERQLALSHGLPLGAYLLRPVQRILKYHLLLQNIVKNYEKEGKDVSILEQAFHHMTQMAHHINEMKRKHEHAVRVQEIQSQLEDYVGEDLTRLGDLVLESTFRVYGAKASRQVFLFERGLLISKKKGGGMLSCKTFIKCSNLMLVEVIPNEPLSFHVIPFDNPRAQYTLQARNMEQKKKWCQEIKRLILESFKGRIPDSVKDLVMQLGSNHDDDYVTKEALDAGRKNQHTAPEYLEKRRFRRKSGSRLPDFSILKPQKAKRAANKKGDEKLEIKGRRAESKSPDAERRLLIPQNAIKRRSQSHNIVTSVVLKPGPAKSNTEQDTTLESEPTPQSPSVTSSDSSFMQTPDRSTVLTDLEMEAEVQLRPRSFRNAVRAHPITSVELNELLSRMRGSGVSRISEELTKQVDTQAVSPMEHVKGTLRNIDDSSEEDVADNVGVSTHKQETTLTLDLGQGHSSQPNDSNHHNGTDSLMSPERQFKKSGKEKFILDNARSTSMPDLNIEEVKSVAKLKLADEQAGMCSLSVTNVNKDESVQKGKGRLSRKDFHNSHIVKRRMKGSQESEPGSTNVSRPVTAFHDTYSKRAAEKTALRSKGAQPTNKSKYLSTPESSSHPQNAKLTVWNSVEKLTKGSMNDLSHLNEDPWVMNPEVTGSTSRAELDPLASSHLPKPSTSLSLGVLSRPRGHSDITEMMQVSLNKENLDWLVYLNRNSFPPKSDQSSPAMKRLSSLGLDQPAAGQGSFSSQLHYATPPRSYMNTENMNRHASGYKESCYNKSKPTVSGVNAFGGSTLPISLTKPILFHANSLMRSNSSPMAGADKTVQRDRPMSMDADNLMDDSDKMLAEMEAYISNSSDSVKSTNKFPTSLPAITVEDEDANNNSKSSNRLSIASSLSTSSYDSQDSNSHSSDGLVGTLKHKLHTWAKRGTRNDSEQSHTSTLTSDDEDAETPQPQFKISSNTFDPPLRSRSSWREDRDLENVLREHGLGSTSLGSRMAFSIPTNVVSPSKVHHCSDIEIENHLSPCDTETPKFDSFSQEMKFSLPPSEGDDAILHHPAASQPDDVPLNTSLSSECVQWDNPRLLTSANGQCTYSLSDVEPFQACGLLESNISVNFQEINPTLGSGISFQNTDATSCYPTVIDNFSRSEPSKDIPPKVARKVKTNNENGKSEEELVSLRKQGSAESVDSVDSFYERRLSVALESDVFHDNGTIIGVYEDPQQEEKVETAAPRKSIREYVQQIEQKLRPPSPKVFEVKRREPGAMIKQKLETLRENILYGRRSSSRQGSEEREVTRAISQPPSQFRNKLTFSNKFENRHSENMQRLDSRLTASRDSLSRSMENLSKPREALSFSKESLLLSISRDSLNADSPTYQNSLSPLKNQNCGTPGHESDANRFAYVNVEHKGNQFLHRARSNSDQPESEVVMSVEGGALSRSMCRLDQVSTEVDNLVIMKGWVRALISKFQTKD